MTNFHFSLNPEVDIKEPNDLTTLVGWHLLSCFQVK